MRNMIAERTSKSASAPYLRPRHLSALLSDGVHNLWLFTKDDTLTFVIPNSVFGVCCTLTGTRLVACENLCHQCALARIPWVLLFNWSNLLVFDLANQRLTESAREDALNKPWRPVPSGRMTPSQVRRFLLLAIPLVFLFNHFVLNVGAETGLLYVLTWMYNDLDGGNEDWILRNFIIAVAFGLYNMGSVKVAASVGLTGKVTPEGHFWILIVSGIILTTMHVQDFKDQAGDKARGRSTAPLILGDRPARWTIAIQVPIWTLFCAGFWRLSWPVSTAMISLGLYVSWRCVVLRGPKSDRKTWQIWCLWTAALYTMPLMQQGVHT